MRFLRKKAEKDPFPRLFARGTKLCTIIFITWIFFFTSWVIASSKEYIIISNTTSYSKFFYFINPNIFKQYILGGNLVSWLFGAVTEESLLFIIFYLVSVISFAIIFISCFILFVISYHTSIKYFQYIACFGIFPVIGIFLITYFVVKLWIHQFDLKFRGASRYQKDFEPEIFEDPEIAHLDEERAAKRPLTSQFTLAHYEKLYVVKKKDLISNIYEWLDLKLK